MEQIEVSILRGLLFNEDYTRKVFPFLREDFFEGNTRNIFSIYKDLFDKYNKQPSLDSLVVALQKSKLDESTYESVLDTIEGVVKSKDDSYDVEWLVDETESYCKSQALYKTIYQSISILEGQDKQHDVNALPGLLQEALAVSFSTSIGSDYFSDILQRYEYYTNEESRIPFPINALNRLSNGGLPKKTLNVFLAGTNVGKSAMMCYLAGEWLKAGYNVLYITLEMSEKAIQERVDANLLDLTTDELKKIKDFETFEKKVKNLQLRTKGRFITKEFPTGSAHAGHFRHLLRELDQKQKFKPDIILCDYINICSSSRYKSMSGVNSYSYIKAIAEELRGLAVEFDVPLVTATQTNREGYGSSAPDMTSVSDSFGLSMTVDWMTALVTNEQLIETSNILGLLLKTRYGNKSKVSGGQMMCVDYDHMRFKDTEFDINQPQKPMSKPHTTLDTKVKEDAKIGIDWG